MVFRGIKNDREKIDKSIRRQHQTNKNTQPLPRNKPHDQHQPNRLRPNSHAHQKSGGLKA